ncbi:hypothetical protein COBT_001587 [Conglomerata obtusa]
MKFKRDDYSDLDNVNDDENSIVLDGICSSFITMVRKTIIFERMYLSKQTKFSKQVFPLMEEAKFKLFRYYAVFLKRKLSLDSDPYLKEFIESME